MTRLKANFERTPGEVMEFWSEERKRFIIHTVTGLLFIGSIVYLTIAYVLFQISSATKVNKVERQELQKMLLRAETQLIGLSNESDMKENMIEFMSTESPNMVLILKIHQNGRQVITTILPEEATWMTTSNFMHPNNSRCIHKELSKTMELVACQH
mmetsp:Transcript_6879/g.10062  ORF Transcript_6879/g.10062 Transcript_6879/m.10062 type:complete len:156 (+) Transcript_6879:72-539(+)